MADKKVQPPSGGAPPASTQEKDENAAAIEAMADMNKKPVGKSGWLPSRMRKKKEEIKEKPELTVADDDDGGKGGEEDWEMERRRQDKDRAHGKAHKKHKKEHHRRKSDKKKEKEDRHAERERANSQEFAQEDGAQKETSAISLSRNDSGSDGFMPVYRKTRRKSARKSMESKGQDRPVKAQGQGQASESSSSSGKSETWSVEDFQATPDRIYQSKFIEALSPLNNFCLLLGLNPFTLFVKSDGSPFYAIQWRSARTIYSLIITGFHFFICIWFWLQEIIFATKLTHGLGQNPQYWKWVRSHEVMLVKRNVTTLVIYNCCLMHLFITHVLIFYKRDFLSQYYTFWIETVELLRLHVVKGVRGFIILKILVFSTFTAALVGFWASHHFQICQGTGATIGLLYFRIFHPELALEKAKGFRVFRIIGNILFVYVFMITKFSAIRFATRCKLIRNLVQVWNRRFRVCLLGTREEQQSMIRSTRAFLFKDHCVWLNLLEGANREIYLNIESFYVMICLSFVYELHHVTRAFSGSDSEFNYCRRLDFAPVLVMIIIDIVYFYGAAIQSGKIIDTVSEAYDIIREKGVLTKRADQELTFMMSLHLSLMGSTDEIGMGLVGWEFVYFSKTYMLVAIGFTTSVFVMLWQFQQPLDQEPANDPFCLRWNVTQFLGRVLEVRSYFTNVIGGRKDCNDISSLCGSSPNSIEKSGMF